MILRISAVIVLLFSILYMPFWLSVILALAGMAYFDLFIEAVFLLLLSDLLYGVQEAKLFNFIFISSIISAVCLIVIELFKKQLRLRSNDL